MIYDLESVIRTAIQSREAETETVVSNFSGTSRDIDATSSPDSGASIASETTLFETATGTTLFDTSTLQESLVECLSRLILEETDQLKRIGVAQAQARDADEEQRGTSTHMQLS